MYGEWSEMLSWGVVLENLERLFFVGKYGLVLCVVIIRNEVVLGKVKIII